MTTLLHPIPMKHRAPVEGFPKGWYCLAESEQIFADTLLPVSWLNQEFIVYRTASGAAQAADAYCPHLGAHLASHEGGIEDGKIVCPFHKWRYDAQTGRCVSIPYAKMVPPVKLKLYPTREINGMVVVWYHPAGEAPDHEPFNSAVLDQGKWVLYDSRDWITTCPFRDVLENLFDTAHIVQLHTATEMPALGSIERTAHGLKVDYVIDPDKSDQPLKRLECQFSGISLMVQHYEFQGAEALFVFSFTPIDDERFVQKTRLYLLDNGNPELLDSIGKPFVARFVYEVDQDMAILNYKKHLPQPRLCDGDGPILRFREYANDFYR